MLPKFFSRILTLFEIIRKNYFQKIPHIKVFLMSNEKNDRKIAVFNFVFKISEKKFGKKISEKKFGKKFRKKMFPNF